MIISLHGDILHNHLFLFTILFLFLYLLLSTHILHTFLCETNSDHVLPYSHIVPSKHHSVQRLFHHNSEASIRVTLTGGLKKYDYYASWHPRNSDCDYAIGRQ